MFEHIRALRTAALAQAEAAVQAAVAGREQARTEVAVRDAARTNVRGAVDAAAANLVARDGELATAQSLVDTRTAERQAAQVGVDRAQVQLADHLAEEPSQTVERDKPNPAYAAWLRKRDELARKVAEAESALVATEPPLTQASQARDSAAAALADAGAAMGRARAALAVADAEVAAANQRVTDAETAIAARRTDAEAAAAGLAELDDRAATLVADPLDRPVLERAADAELADLHAGWQQQHDLFAARGAAEADRTAVLATHDRTMDDVGGIRTAIAAWPDAGRWGAVGAAVPVLDAVLQANAAERGRAALDRTDDVPGVRQRLAEQIAALESVRRTARAERDAAQASLDSAITALKQHQQKGP